MKHRLMDGGGEKHGKRESLSRSKNQEKEVAGRLLGHTVVGSGNRWYAKGDVKSKDWLVECKRTDKQSYSLKKSELEKAIVEAVTDGREMMFQVEIDGLKLAIITMDKFVELTGKDDNS